MAEPRMPPKSKPGYIKWGLFIADCAFLTEPQYAALVRYARILAHDERNMP
jgi:hypothetical protein